MKIIKLFLLFLLCVLSISAQAESKLESKFKFENKVIEVVKVQDKNFSIDFKILCINGYQYLHNGTYRNTVQMFYKPKFTSVSLPIECNGFEEK